MDNLTPSHQLEYGTPAYNRARGREMRERYGEREYHLSPEGCTIEEPDHSVCVIPKEPEKPKPDTVASVLYEILNILLYRLFKHLIHFEDLTVRTVITSDITACSNANLARRRTILYGFLINEGYSINRCTWELDDELKEGFIIDSRFTKKLRILSRVFDQDSVLVVSAEGDIYRVTDSGRTPVGKLVEESPNTTPFVNNMHIGRAYYLIV